MKKNSKKKSNDRKKTKGRIKSEVKHAARRSAVKKSRAVKPTGYDGTVPTVVGVIDCKGDRFGFIPHGDGDVYVHGHNLFGARHGDTVRVLITDTRPLREGGVREEGQVIEILERNPMNIVATVVYEDNAFFAVPDDRHFGDKLDVVSLGGAAEHDKVIIEIVPSRFGDTAKVVAVLGRFDEIGMDVKSVIASHNLRTEFPQDVLLECEAFPDTIDESEAEKPYRADFRGSIIFTIDGADSKDFDDAVSIERTPTGGYKLGVYIADVAEYVKKGAPLDREAYLRGTSVYLADRVIPMLPEKLSNGLCSLNEGEDRLTLAVLMDFDGSGNMLDYEITEGVIRSSARLTYTGVQAMLDGDEALRARYAAVVPSLEAMKELALKRIKLRKERGSIDFTLTETQIKFDSVGHVVDIEKRPSLLSMKIIEEFMIAANCAVAEKFSKLKIPFVYRVHERPSGEKLQNLNAFLEAVGVRARISLTPNPKQVASLLSGIDEDISAAVNKIALRSMAKATYEPRNEGHFGLNEEYYCHFTSPIRRYPDLMIHRIIKTCLREGVKATKKFRDDTVSAAKQSSKTERVAQDCERKVDDCKKAEYMSHHIGEKYTGVISSVTDFGYFVELPNSAEGLVRMGHLPPAASFDKRRMCIVCGRKQYRLGDKADVIVEKVEGDRIDFRPV
ncbi:MAG: ribonuclease R [Clostridiales bacterium]|nr:ribonuclease R [Clostridiales bacterium]